MTFRLWNTNPIQYYTLKDMGYFFIAPTIRPVLNSAQMMISDLVWGIEFTGYNYLESDTAEPVVYRYYIDNQTFIDTDLITFPQNDVEFTNGQDLLEWNSDTTLIGHYARNAVSGAKHCVFAIADVDLADGISEINIDTTLSNSYILKTNCLGLAASSSSVSVPTFVCVFLTNIGTSYASNYIYGNGVLNNPQTGLPLSQSARVLVNGQTDAKQNGIYVHGITAGPAWELVRTTPLTNGDTWTTNASYCTVTSTPGFAYILNSSGTVGTNNIVFSTTATLDFTVPASVFEAFTFDQTSFTFSFWIKRSNTTSDLFCAVAVVNPSNLLVGISCQFYQDNGVTPNVLAVNDDTEVELDFDVSATAWTNIVVSGSNTTITLYRNATSVYSGTHTAESEYEGSGLINILGSSITNSDFFEVTNFYVFSSALNQEQITYLYNNPKLM